MAVEMAEHRVATETYARVRLHNADADADAGAPALMGDSLVAWHASTTYTSFPQPRVRQPGYEVDCGGVIGDPVVSVITRATAAARGSTVPGSRRAPLPLRGPRGGRGDAGRPADRHAGVPRVQPLLPHARPGAHRPDLRAVGPPLARRGRPQSDSCGRRSVKSGQNSGSCGSRSGGVRRRPSGSTPTEMWAISVWKPRVASVAIVRPRC